MDATTMQAWQVSGSGEPASVMSLGLRAMPEPGPGEVRVRVGAAGLGLPDVFMCRGSYVFAPPQPFVPGQEVAGVVDAAGQGSAWSPGERVMGVTCFYNGHGGFAPYCIAADFSLYPVPGGMDDIAAAAFTIPFHTAWVGLVTRAALQPGETLLVHGAAGGTGDAGIRLGKALGARVIAVAGGAEKTARCRAAGADHVIDHRAEDFVASVLSLTDRRGADVVYDPVGGEVFERSVSCAADGGRLLAVGFACGRWGAPDSGKLVARNCAALGVFVGAHGHDELLASHAELCALFATGKMLPGQADVVAFDGIGAALERLAQRDAAGKMVARMV